MQNKVPEVTLGFWVVKILATTLVGIQIAAKRFHLFLYWSVIVASTTAGTTSGRTELT